MGFTLYSLLKAALLVMNALTVLNEKRFLSKCTFVAAGSGAPAPPHSALRAAHTDGLTPQATTQQMDGFGAPMDGGEDSLKKQASGLLFTMRYMQSTCWQRFASVGRLRST